MISSKYLKIITVVFLIFAVAVSVFIVTGAVQPYFDAKTVPQYQNELFDTSKIIEIDIHMDENEWRTMLDNATDEIYYECDVTINGTSFTSVGIRPKGNTSLSSVARDPENDRYSFKLEFDQFVTAQSCFGLDKLVLNNNYADATNMKEALIYDMYLSLDADAPLYNYAKISVNGEYFGLYLALEAVEDSFMLRNYGNEKGFLYKPDSMDMGNMGKPGENSNNGEKAERGNGGMFGRGGGSNLNYTDDNLDSYGAIWNGEVNDSDTSDHKRVVEALKNIHAGTNLEKCMDIDNLLKYAAVHSFAVNDDSLSGNMAHNYYLYEAGGRLNIIPWDYNLSFGGMHGGDSTSVINDPIEMPFAGTKFFDTLLGNEQYKAKYHEYYNKLVTEYFDGGRLDEFFENTAKNVDELIKEDPNTMYTYEEYVKAKDVLYTVAKLRSESIKGQLDGTIPSDTEGQRADSSALIDGSSINLSDMGSFMGGGRDGGMFGGMGGNRPSRTQNENSDVQNGNQMHNQTAGNGMPGFPSMNIPNADESVDVTASATTVASDSVAGGNFPQFNNGEFGGDQADAVQGEMPGGMPEGMQGGMPGNMQGRMPQGGFGGFNGEMPEGMEEWFGGRNGMQSTEPEAPKTFMDIVKENATPIFSIVLLAGAFVFVIFYKKKNF